MKYIIFLLLLGYFPCLSAQDCYDKETFLDRGLWFSTYSDEPFAKNPDKVVEATVAAKNSIKITASYYEQGLETPNIIYTFKNLHSLTLSSSFGQDDFLGLKDLNCLQFIRVSTICINAINPDSCYFYTIPKGFCLVPNLKELKVTRARTRFVPACIFEHPKLELFELFELGGKDTLHLPSNILNPGNISKLTIVGNNLYNIPEGFCNQPNLVRLDLRRNKLKALPKDIHLLKKVNMLDVSENPIESLPETFGEMDGLITLNLSKTKLKKFPEVLFKLKKIRRIHLVGTNCTKDGEEREAIYNKFAELGNHEVVIFW